MRSQDIKKVACVGAGLIGSSFAVNFAMKGYPVTIYDIADKQLDAAREAVAGHLAGLRKYGILTADQADAAARLVGYSTGMQDAVGDVQFIQESGPENYEIKQRIMAEIEKYAPADTIIASSTSGLLVSEIARFARHPERCIGAHPYNPPHLIPLIEISKGDKSSPAAVTCACDFYTLLGKEPIVLRKEALGFIANRLQVALYREAVDLVTRGVCSVADVDRAVTFGPGLRWAVMGPNLLFHLGGGPHGIKGIIGHIGPSVEKWWEDMADWKKFPAGWGEQAQQGVEEEIAERPAVSGRTAGEIATFRDRMLLEMLKLHNKL